MLQLPGGLADQAVKRSLGETDFLPHGAGKAEQATAEKQGGSRQRHGRQLGCSLETKISRGQKWHARERMGHEMLKAFVVSLNVPLAAPPIFSDAISGFVFTHDQPVLVTPAKSD